MSIGEVNGVAGGTTGAGIDDFEIIEELEPNAGAPAGQQPAAADGIGEFEEVDFNETTGRDALQQAHVAPGGTPPTLAGRLREVVHARHTLGNWFKNTFAALGRTLMGIHHKLWGLKQPSALDAALTLTNVRGNAPVTTLPALDEPQGERPVRTFSAEEVGHAFGLRRAVWQPFPHQPGQTAREIAYPNLGRPVLEDIHQDPKLQDCWFLSSIGAILRAGGSAAIERLITLPDDPDAEGAVARVKLGANNVYEVPFAEIRGDNGSSSAVSKSAPWVKILEQAMQMHRLQESGGTTPENFDMLGEVAVKMAYNSPRIGLNALMGRNWEPDSGELRNLADPAGALKAMLDAGRPVVLGSPDSYGTALSTGISPGHAVTLVEIDEVEDVATVLDPYGKVKNVRLANLANYTYFAGDIDLHPPRNQQAAV